MAGRPSPVRVRRTPAASAAGAPRHDGSAMARPIRAARAGSRSEPIWLQSSTAADTALARLSGNPRPDPARLGVAAHDDLQRPASRPVR